MCKAYRYRRKVENLLRKKISVFEEWIEIHYTPYSVAATARGDMYALDRGGTIKSIFAGEKFLVPVLRTTLFVKYDYKISPEKLVDRYLAMEKKDILGILNNVLWKNAKMFINVKHTVCPDNTKSFLIYQESGITAERADGLLLTAPPAFFDAKSGEMI